jgi:hypothetical protein
MQRLTSLNRRSENVVTHPIIVAEICVPGLVKAGCLPAPRFSSARGLPPGPLSHGASGAESRRVPAL